MAKPIAVIERGTVLADDQATVRKALEAAGYVVVFAANTGCSIKVAAAPCDTTAQPREVIGMFDHIFGRRA